MPQLPCSGWEGVAPSLLLLLSGDVEPNPGPRAGREPKPDKAKIMADKVDAQEKKLEELEELVQSQKALIEEMTKKQVALEQSLEEKQVALQELKVSLQQGLEERQVLQDSLNKQQVMVEGLQQGQVEGQLGHENLRKEHEETTEDLRGAVEQIRSRLTGVDKLGSQSDDTSYKVKEIENELEEIQEKLWELDKSWQNNLVFYGVKGEPGATEEHPSVTETKIRDILKRHLQINRDVSLVRVKRTWNGPDVRGSKPITVCFEKWQDKDEVMRKGKLLKGSNIYVGEDFSKRIKEQRAELHKFLRHLRKQRPDAKFRLQYDKLFVDHEVYMYNDITGHVEQVNFESHPQTPLVQHEDGQPQSQSPTLQAGKSMSSSSSHMRKKSSGRRRLQKSYSSESSLNHIVPNSPVYPESPTKGYHSRTRSKSPASPTKVRANSEATPEAPNSGENRLETPSSSKEDSKKTDPNTPEKSSTSTSEENHKKEHDDDEDEIIEYTDISAYSPIKRGNPIIPETIPE